MEFVKLRTNYDSQAPMLRAGEPAEVLYTRALAYAGEHETDGFVPTEVLERLTPTKPRARAAALAREGIFEAVKGGWQIAADWWGQITKEDLDSRRAATRDRVTDHRKRKPRTQPPNPGGNGVTPTVTNSVSNGVGTRNVPVREVEVEVDTAAAAAVPATRSSSGDVVDQHPAGGGADAPATAPTRPVLPVKVEILRSRMQQYTRLEALRWDTLDAAKISQLEQLIDLHGDEKLTARALDTCRPTPPVSVAAFFGTWASLPPPGQRLAAVPEPGCPEPGHSGTVRHCNQCAADQKAAR